MAETVVTHMHRTATHANVKSAGALEQHNRSEQDVLSANGERAADEPGRLLGGNPLGRHVGQGSLCLRMARLGDRREPLLAQRGELACA